MSQFKDAISEKTDSVSDWVYRRQESHVPEGDDTLVIVKFRNGEVDPLPLEVKYHDWDFLDTGDNEFDIIAWKESDFVRPVFPPKSPFEEMYYKAGKELLSLAIIKQYIRSILNSGKPAQEIVDETKRFIDASIDGIGEVNAKRKRRNQRTA